MAEIELAPLSHRLDEDEVKTLWRLLSEAGAPTPEKADEHASHTIAARLSEEALTEFLDRLDAHDLGAEIYVPVEFEGRVTIGDFRVASQGPARWRIGKQADRARYLLEQRACGRPA